MRDQSIGWGVIFYNSFGCSFIIHFILVCWKYWFLTINLSTLFLNYCVHCNCHCYDRDYHCYDRDYHWQSSQCCHCTVGPLKWEDGKRNFLKKKNDTPKYYIPSKWAKGCLLIFEKDQLITDKISHNMNILKNLI